MMRLSTGLGASMAAMLLGACSMTQFSGAASMRVDVEVYKGPLAKDPWTQWGEFIGTLNEVTTSLAHFDVFLAATAAEAKCVATTAPDQAGPLPLTRQALEARIGAANAAISELVNKINALQPRINAGNQPNASLFSKISGAAAEAEKKQLEEEQKQVTARKTILEGIDKNRVEFTDPVGTTLRKEVREELWKQAQGFLHHARESNWQLHQEHCLTLAGLRTDLRELTTSSHSLLRMEREIAKEQSYKDIGQTLRQPEVRKTLSELAEVLGQIHKKALFWAGYMVADEPSKRSVRSMMVTFAALAAEYANQVSTRADTLLQQIDGPDRRELPLSVYLQNTNPTDFLNLYAWKNATDTHGTPDARYRNNDRVRTMERLYADSNWSKVNTVYASGRGDVAMAFIKDDVGNWNLKSFDNDPTELLKAYNNVGYAALKTASELIAVGASGGGVAAARAALSLANQVSSGRTGGVAPTVAGMDIQELHLRTAEQIADLKLSAANRTKTLDTAIKERGPAIEAQAKVVAAAATKVSETRQGSSTSELLAKAQRMDDEAETQDFQVKVFDEEHKDQKLTEVEASSRNKLVARADASRKEAKSLRADAAKQAPAEATLRTEQDKLARLKADQDEDTKALKALPSATATRAADLLDRHRQLLDLMQEGVGRSTSRAGGGGSDAALSDGLAARRSVLPDVLRRAEP